jgi:CRP-like cAMP-binding protein
LTFRTGFNTFQLGAESEKIWNQRKPEIGFEGQSHAFTVLNKGEQSPGLYLLTHGTAIEVDPDTGVRMRSLMPGNVIAAAAGFGGYTAPATIRAESDCKLAFLSADACRLLEREDPSLAITLHGFLIQCAGRWSKKS